MEKTRRHETLARALGRLISHRQRLKMPERGQCFRHPAGEEAVADIEDAEKLAIRHVGRNFARQFEVRETDRPCRRA